MDMTETKELTCGVCKELYRNPYRLPCSHSFCRRPCLLQTASSIYARCIYCHIEIHKSEMEPNVELEDRVQSYLANKGNPECRLVACQFCRSLFDHCTVCPHCDRQLCGLCFSEHADGFKRRLRRSLQNLQDACNILKQLKKALVYSRDSAERISELPKRIDYATIALKSACESSFWRAKTHLNRLEAQLKDKPLALLNERNLMKNARNLLRTVNSPKQHEGIVNLCKVKEAAQNAVETLRALAQLEAGQGHPVLRNISVADSLQSLGEQLDNMNLLDQGSEVAKPGKKVTFHNNPLNDSGTRLTRSIFRQFEIRDQVRHSRNLTGEPVIPKDQIKTKNQNQENDQHHYSAKRSKSAAAAATTTTTAAAAKEQQELSQQQRRLRQHWSADNSPKVLTLFVDGVRACIAMEDLMTHFGQFGEVLDVRMNMNPVTNEHNGNGCIILRPTVNPSEILRMEHTVGGVRVNVKRKNSVRSSSSRCLKTAVCKGQRHNQDIIYSPEVIASVGHSSVEKNMSLLHLI
ncbi:hypothetical protein SprV_0200957600 [Sparganum proliferum]